MKIIVVGGSGLIGSQVVSELAARGHKVMSASPGTGVDTVTGAGLTEALEGKDVLIDVSNSPSFEASAALAFFEKSGHNLAKEEKSTGIGHHVTLSVVGSERMPDSGYFRAKVAQEEIIKNAGVPYSIVRATQFFEFLGGIADSGAEGDVIRLPNALFQPMASADVALAVVEAALAPPLNDTVEVAGPERLPITEAVERFLMANDDARKIITDSSALYFGAKLNDQTLVPGDDPKIGRTNLDNWIRDSMAKK